MSGRESMIIFFEVSPAENVTWPDMGETSRAVFAPLSAVTFQVTVTCPKVPLAR